MKYVMFGFACIALFVAFFLGSSYYESKQAEKFGFMAE